MLLRLIKRRISTLEKVRRVLKKEEVDLVIICNTDPHKSEYLNNEYKTIEKVSGFSGSNAVCLVSSE